MHPWLAATTVRHLLAMRGPHRATTYQLGAVFTYDTSGSYVLAALVERLAGVSLTDYLRPGCSTRWA